MNAPDKSVDTVNDPITQNNYSELPQFADRSDPLLLLQESESSMLLKNGLTKALLASERRERYIIVNRGPANNKKDIKFTQRQTRVFLARG